jgi:hypothetical protein
MTHAANHGRIAISTMRRRGGVRYVAQRELRRFVTTPACWVVVHPREIVEPELRLHAIAAWEAAGAPTCYAISDLAAQYGVSGSTIGRWRERGWCAEAWHWHGGAERGAWWLVWAGPMPEPLPVPYIQPRIQPTRRAVGAARRIAVLAAVEQRGGPPGRGRAAPGFWEGVAADTGASVKYAQRIWYVDCRKEATV